MPEWSLSLAVLTLGLIGLGLGRAVVQRALGPAACPLDSGGRRRLTLWPALVAMLPAMAVTLQSVSSGASALGLGVILSVHILGVLAAIGTVSPSYFTDTAAEAGVHRARSRAWSLSGAAVGVWGLALDGGLGRIDGGVLVLLWLLYLTWMAGAARQPAPPDDASGSEPQPAPAADAGHLARPVRTWRRRWKQFAGIGVGLTLLTIGARVLTMGALDLALVLELDHRTLGLTLVAPACLLAGWVPWLSVRRRPSRPSWSAPSLWFDFSLVNLLGLVGLTALTTPGGLPFTREMLWVSWPLVILTSLLAAAALMRAEPA